METKRVGPDPPSHPAPAGLTLKMLSRSRGYLGGRREGGVLALRATPFPCCAHPLGFQNVRILRIPGGRLLKIGSSLRWGVVVSMATFRNHRIYRWEAEAQRRDGQLRGLPHPVFPTRTLPLSLAGLALGPRTRPWVSGPVLVLGLPSLPLLRPLLLPPNLHPRGSPPSLLRHTVRTSPSTSESKTHVLLQDRTAVLGS